MLGKLWKLTIGGTCIVYCLEMVDFPIIFQILHMFLRFGNGYGPRDQLSSTLNIGLYTSTLEDFWKTYYEAVLRGP